jgi:hypothetical protein
MSGEFFLIAKAFRKEHPACLGAWYVLWLWLWFFGILFHIQDQGKLTFFELTC